MFATLGEMLVIASSVIILLSVIVRRQEEISVSTTRYNVNIMKTIAYVMV
jgi:hypothetical protein